MVVGEKKNKGKLKIVCLVSSRLSYINVRYFLRRMSNNSIIVLLLNAYNQTPWSCLYKTNKLTIKLDQGKAGWCIHRLLFIITSLNEAVPAPSPLTIISIYFGPKKKMAVMEMMSVSLSEWSIHPTKQDIIS